MACEEKKEYLMSYILCDIKTIHYNLRAANILEVMTFYKAEN